MDGVLELPTEVQDRPDKYVIYVDAPECRAQDVRVSARKRRVQVTTPQGTCTVTLPDPIDEAGIAAEFFGGELRVAVPKR
ncbi:Hsp20/alpha crystallin family protein [Natronomonas sp. EA1]|uniref:Hsp20/alpha crystallin family protein n=1 Tax=Natronomonas sp. EA1 TaxID=3421655 RepID=UPI003EBC8290